MASISPTSIQCAAEPYTGKNAHLKLTITSISDSDASTNQRYVGWKITVEGTSWATLSARYASLGGHEIRPFTSKGVFGWTTGQQLDSGTETYSNDASGNLTLYAYLKQLFYYSYNATSWANNSQAADANMVCSQLPRYANFTKHEISSTGINTFSVTWGADASCDTAQYSLNGGNWTNASFPTYTISSLSPGTQYNIRTRIKRQDSQLWTTSGYLYPTTASLPSTGTPSNFNLGSSPTASISSMSNLSKWYCDVYDGNTKIASSGNVTATSKTISLTSSTIINGMLGRHPNDNEWTITFKYYCVSNGVTYTLTQRTCKCIIPSGQYVPTFNANNISYEVTDQQSLNLTGSNKKVIKGISDILVTLTPASPNGSATMKSYNATSGNSTGSTTNTSTPKINLTNVSANSVTAQAVDSRNRTTNANKAFSTFIDYFAPVITSSSINRIDGVGTNLTVNITGNYCNWSGLTTTNIIEQVSIQYKLKSASTYTTISGVNLNIVNSSGTFTITGNITGNHFSASNEYDVLLTFKDKINNLPFHQVIPTGEALLWRDKLNKRIGIGKKPTTTLDVDGSLSVSKTSTNYNGGAIPGTKDAAASTVGDLLNEVRMTNGQMGSVQITKPYTSNNITIAATWYNYFYIPHRTGGSSGSANGDNCNYGNLILVGMTSDTPMYLVRKSASTTQVSCLSKNLIKAAVSNKTHTDFNNHQDYLPTMNFLSYWNGAYNSSNASNLTYAYQGTIQCKPTQLYNNSTGTTGTITLSQTAANFLFIRVYYRDMDSCYSSVDIYSPNGKIARIGTIQMDTINTLLWLQAAEIKISGTSLTFANSRRTSHSSNYSSIFFANNQIWVTLVEGWN